MSDRLSKLLPHLRMDVRAFVKMDKSPVLVWEAAPVKKANRPLVLGTLPNFKLEPPAHDPLVFRLKKMNRVGNAFALGVTVGRTETNDIAIDDGSVSRFHAYFQQDKSSGIWHVVDAESFNGTSCDGVWLQPSRPAPVHDKTELKFGNVQVRFYLPETFGEWATKRSA